MEESIVPMFTVHPDVKYENATPEQKACVKEMILKKLTPYLEKGLPSFQILTHTSLHLNHLKCCVKFEPSVYLDVCRETIKGPFCFKFKGYHACEITLVQNMVTKVDSPAEPVAPVSQ
jgi:hypothetical protein